MTRVARAMEARTIRITQAVSTPVVRWVEYMLISEQVLKAHQIDGHGGIADRDRGRRGQYRGRRGGEIDT